MAQHDQHVHVLLPEVHEAHHAHDGAVVLGRAALQFSVADHACGSDQRCAAQVPEGLNALSIHALEEHQFGEDDERSMDHQSVFAHVLDHVRGDLDEVPRRLVDSVALLELGLIDQHVSLFLQKLLLRVALRQNRMLVRLEDQQKDELQQQGEGGRLAVV